MSAAVTSNSEKGNDRIWTELGYSRATSGAEVHPCSVVCVSNMGWEKMQSIFSPGLQLGRLPVSPYAVTVTTGEACACHTTYTKGLYNGIQKVLPKCAGTPTKVSWDWRKGLEAKWCSHISVPVWGRIWNCHHQKHLWNLMGVAQVEWYWLKCACVYVYTHSHAYTYICVCVCSTVL